MTTLISGLIKRPKGIRVVGLSLTETFLSNKTVQLNRKSLEKMETKKFDITISGVENI